MGGSSRFVIGVDIGGSSTRSMVVTMTGKVAGRGASRGANPYSHRPEKAAKRVAEAITESLGRLDPRGAQCCVLGMAGATVLADPEIADIFHGRLRDIGLRCPVRIVTDAEAAFASATDSPEGTVLIAGTGSIACRISGRRTAARAGGFGWLLGDEGSGFWIGREAVVSTLRTLQSGAKPGPLAVAVLREALGPREHDEPLAKLIISVDADAPVRLARFAALVSDTVTDPVSAGIVERAAHMLADQVWQVHRGGTVVLGGSVACQHSPVGKQLHDLLVGIDVQYATDAAAGAAWLAALEVLGPDAPRAVR